VIRPRTEHGGARGPVVNSLRIRSFCSGAIPVPHFIVHAKVNTESPDLIRPELRRLFPKASLTLTGDPKELVVAGEMDGENARELNRGVLTELRRVERRTRLRAEWTSEGTTEKFFDYVPKGKRGPPDAVH
jgi:hypothetical protein